MNKGPAIFIQPNKLPLKSDKHPHYRIVLANDGVFVDIGSAWKKLDKNNRVYLSVSLNKGWEIKKTDDVRENTIESVSDISADEIPF